MWTSDQIIDFVIRVGIPTAILFIILYGLWRFVNDRGWPLLEGQIKSAQELRSTEMARYLEMQQRFIEVLDKRDDQRHVEHINYIKSLARLDDSNANIVEALTDVKDALERLSSQVNTNGKSGV